jgi:hypothetical protein
VTFGVAANRVVFHRPGRIAATIITFCVFGYPLLALVQRSWTSAEVFGVAPDPTAIATVAALALVRGRIRWLLLFIPLLWCALAAATLWAMDAPQAWIVLVATLAALVPRSGSTA